MHMHATSGEGMRQTVLIRKFVFVAQCRRGAVRRDNFP
jgi:hypothetical protein